MKVSISEGPRAGKRFVCIALVSLVVGTGTAAADTFRHGTSTATIEQSGGSAGSESRVHRCEDGQSIVTRDGNSTDVVIQGNVGCVPADQAGEPRHWYRDRFDADSDDDRFPGFDPCAAGAEACVDRRSQGASEAFKRRMLDRMRGSIFSGTYR